VEALKGNTTRGLGVFMSMAGGKFYHSLIFLYGGVLSDGMERADNQLLLLMLLHLEYLDSSPLLRSEGRIRS
jgi:hypothetical protein